MSSWSRLVTSLVLGYLGLAATSGAQPQAQAGAVESGLWGAGPFAASPGQLLAAGASAGAKPEEQAVVLLREEADSFDEQGRQTRTERIVVRVISSGAVPAWEAIQVVWEPWHQDRPEIKARVVTPSGEERWLDRATIAEAPADTDAPQLFGDRRLLRAPLPAVAAGVVVELLTVVQDREPEFDGGLFRSFAIGLAERVECARLVLRAPRSLPLNYEVVGAEAVVPRISEVGAVRQLDFAWGPLDPLKAPEVNLPPSVYPFPFVFFSTGASWSEVAARYSETVERQLGGADVSALTHEARRIRDVSTRVETVLRSLRHEVRYTGVEFGAAAIVPARASETLSRRYGDCKDQATLLVAMLRSVGVPAHVALLFAGPRLGFPHAALPGMGAFNHAIVYVPGPPPRWIDPSSPYTRAGNLPVVDQGRLALVAAPDTAALLRTPEGTSDGNWVRETREIYLSEYGPARIVQTTEALGATEEGIRSAWDGVNPTRATAHLKDLVVRRYGAKELGESTVPDPRDLSGPYRVSVEALGASRITSAQSEAVVQTHPLSLLASLPSELVTQVVGPADQQPERKEGYCFDAPTVYETLYRVVPPPGWAPRRLPGPESARFGGAVYSREFSTTKDGEILATYRLDTGPRCVSADEFRKFREGLRTLATSAALEVGFDQIGEQHLATGGVREALAEFDRLARLHPDEALHRLQRARALLVGGLGEQAREIARKAVETEPSSAFAHRTLGWILRHDLIGRDLAKGLDREGAVAAYRKAKELDPDDAETRADLALVLEHTADGDRYDDSASLDQAIAEYRALREDLDNTRWDTQLLYALMYAGKMRELAEFARGAKSDEAGIMEVVAVAAQDGAPSALAEAERCFPSLMQRRKALRQASDLLIWRRYYKEAAALLEAAAQGAGDAVELTARLEKLRQVRRYEDSATDPHEPAGVVRAFLGSVLRGGTPDEVRGRVRGLFTRAAGELLCQSDDLAERIARHGSSLPGGWQQDVGVDLGVSNARIAVEGDVGTGWRARVTSDLAGSDFSLVFYLLPEGGEPRIAGTDRTLALLGHELLAGARSNDLPTARRLLDWAREKTRPVGGDDPLFDQVPLWRFWTRGETGDEARVRAAAASLLVSSGAAERVLGILESGRLASADTVGNVNPERWDLALQIGYATLDWPAEELRAAERLCARYPGSFMALRPRIRALVSLDRQEEAEVLARNWLAGHPDDQWAARLVAEVQLGRGDLAGARSTLQRLVDRGTGLANDYNTLAWYAMFADAADIAALEQARRATELSERKSYSSMHTLATVLASRGSTSEALQVLAAGIEHKESKVVDGDDWYVIGRVAEWHGLPDVARKLYARVPVPEDPLLEPSSTHRLAMTRLARLAEPAPTH